MGRIQQPFGVQSVQSLDELRRFVASALNDLYTQFNGKLDFGDNIRTNGPLAAAILTVNIPTRVKHSLGRVPTGYFTVGQNNPGQLYYTEADKALWTEAEIFVRSANVVLFQILVF